MQKIYRILIVITLAMILAIFALDYFGFHGSIILGPIGGGAVIVILDTIMGLFQGPNRFTNMAFISVITIGLVACIMAIVYMFIKD